MKIAFQLKYAGFAALMGVAVVTACGDDTTDATGPTSGPGPGATTSASSSGAGAGGPASSSMASTGAGGGLVQTCANYCALLEANCTGSDKQFDGASASQNCMDTCALYPPGTADDMAGHTLGCHIYHADAASTDSGLHCPHAGPYGGGLCGTDQCSNFCDIMAAACTGTEEVYTAASAAACATDCGAFSDATTPFTADQNETTNPFQCRGYHLTAAASMDNPHCQHVGGPSADGTPGGNANGISTTCP